MNVIFLLSKWNPSLYWQSWWNSGTEIVEQWNNDGGTVGKRWLNSGTMRVEQWNRYSGTVEQRWWNSRTEMVEQ